MVLLPEEAEMTLAELRQMAARQQHQIEAQQQLLVAKEQRLKFLKQQEVRHHSLAEQQVDTSCIQNLRDKVEAQELKLRHLRALRGQVEQQKTNNGNLGAELESIRALFSEKEKELNLAVNKVEELTRQLDEIRNNNNRKRTIVPTITAELENFRRELMYRTKLTEQQNNHVSQQRELITQKQQDISHLDNKIGELTQRLHRKRLLNQQLASQIHNASLARHSAASVTNASIYSMSNIAAVEPIQREIQEPEHTQDDLSAKLHRSIRGDLSEFSLKKNDPKYQTLPYNTKFTLKDRQNLDDQLQADDEVFSNSSDNSSSSQRTSSISPPKPNHNMVNFAPRPFGSAYNANIHLSGARIFKQQHSQFSKYSENVQSKPTAPVQAVSALSETYSNGNLELEKSPSDDQVDHCSSAILNNNDNDNEKSKQTQITDSKKLKEKYSVDNGAIVKPVVPPKPAFPVKPIPPPRQTTTPTKERNSSEKNDIISMALSVLQSKSSEKDKSALSNYKERLLYYRCVPRYSLQPTTRSKTPQEDGSVSENRISTYFPKPVSNDPKLIENGNISENVKRKPSSGHLPIKPKPLTIRKTPGLEPPKLKVQPTVNLGMYRKIQEPNILSSHFKPTVGSTITAVLPQKDEIRNSVLSDDQNNADDTSIRTDISKVYDGNEDSLCLSVTVEDTKHSELEALDTWEAVQEVVLKMEEQVENSIKMSEQSEPEENSDSASDSLEGPQNHDSSEVPEIEAANCENELSIYQSAAFRRMRKGNLKTEGSVRSPRRVSFDPLALLLDAALEGELELVKKTASEVPNPSAANDEGITALHNAICAGHFEVVTFLIEFGCDVNAQDSDGWTPLHCAASCNNLPMVKFLVERGACIFATTLSDHETAAEKCEEDEEGFDGCSEYLYGLQENLGVINEGIVYAVYDYEGQNSDELSFKDGDMLNVLRNGDDQENEWWWSRLVDEEGYVPRNLLGLYPRIAFRKE